MRVTALETFVLRAAPPEVYWGARTWSAGEGGELRHTFPVEARRRYLYSPTIDTVLVRVETEDQVTGWGECKAPVAAGATAAIVDELLAPLVVGSRLDEIAVTWERMYAGMRVRGHDAGFWLEALSGVDIALWDAWGRTLGQPVHGLLGGAFRERVPVYASGIPAAPDARERAGKLRAEGWTAVKVAIGLSVQDDIAAVRAVSEVFPRVFADAAGQYDVRQALYVGRALQEIGCGFFEMPIPPEHVDGYRQLAERLDVPIALDSLPGRLRALEYLRAGALHVLQPDVCRAGGITETMRIAALADAFGAQATPHVSIGSPVHFAASLSCAAAMPNLDIVEHWIGDNPLSVIAAAPPPRDGAREVIHRPGLGLDVDETKVRALAQ